MNAATVETESAANPGRSAALGTTNSHAEEPSHAERVGQRAEQFRRWPLSVLLSSAASLLSAAVTKRPEWMRAEDVVQHDAMTTVLSEYGREVAGRPSAGAMEDLARASAARGDAQRLQTLTGLRATNHALEMAAFRAEARADVAERAIAEMRTARRPVASMILYDEDGVAFGSAVLLDDGDLVRFAMESGAPGWCADFDPIPGTPAAIDANRQREVPV